MLYLTILATLLAGAAVSGAARLSPRRSAQFETCGGVLLVGGLILLGAALPH